VGSGCGGQSKPPCKGVILEVWSGRGRGGEDFDWFVFGQ
jgi:hypothetical protein